METLLAWAEAEALLYRLKGAWARGACTEAEDGLGVPGGEEFELEEP
jgi:hypothetical protein